MKTIYTTLLILCFGMICAQKIELQTAALIEPNTTYLPGNSWNGMFFNASYTHLISEEMHLIAGLEFQSNSWANHLFVNLGIDYKLLNREPWFLDAQLSFGNGLSLFQQKPLYSIHARALLFWNYKTTKNNIWGIGSGVNYISTPGYSKYSSNYRAVNFPIVLRFGF
jgi:hypothetical protein